MMEDPRHRLMDLVREESMPHRFCAGCGCGTVLNVFTNAVDGLGLDPQRMVCVSGIGCSSWIPSPYFRADTLHTTHGRPLAFATGVKCMRPDLTVVCIAGDGDIAGIGGNHLIHAARRNIDLTVIMVNNMIYGMTGGQAAPTTPLGVKTTTTPHRNVEPPFQIAEVVAAAGASYVARWTTYHVFPLMEAIQNGLRKRGFSFIEAISQCPDNYGRRIGIRSGSEFLEMFRDRSVRLRKAAKMSAEELQDRIIVGTLRDEERPEFVGQLHGVTEEVTAEMRKQEEAGA
jgi:2-oxoglutarate ferredoxin oxidoreductase subunit beta